jgi:AAA family ATP:ADP antiporter
MTARPPGSVAVRKSLLERFLSLFADVRAGEGTTALLLAVNVFGLLAFYYVLKTVRESLILSEGGAEVKSYSAAGQALLLLVLVPAYGAFASRVGRMKLVSGVTVFFASHLLVFYALGVAGLRVGVAFFLWVGVFNLVVVAQFWAFANDIYTKERGKRLFPIVGLGSSLGAWVGAQVASLLFEGFGPYRLLLLSAGGLVVCVLISFYIHRREQSRVAAVSASESEQPLGKEGGFQLVLRERYLLLIAMLVVVVNLVNTVGEFLLGSLVEQEAARVAASGGPGMAAFIGQFYGSFFGAVNLLGFLFQLLLVSRMFKLIGVGGSLFVLPIIALFSYGTMAFIPVLAAVRLAKTLENAADYSIQNTTRHALFLPTSREAKYKAQQAIDSFFWRAGDVLQAVVVFAGTQLAFGLRSYAAVNLVLVGVWLLIVVGIYREYRKLAPAGAGRQVAA